MNQRFIDLLAMSRFANLPTVWSNVLAALLFGGSFHINTSSLVLDWVLWSIPISCLYLGGCFFNDWHDADFDASNRPDRAIPSGRWSRNSVLYFALAFMGGGVLGSFHWGAFSGISAILILCCILIYTRWHKTNPDSLVFMAGARVMIYPTVILGYIPLTPINSWTFVTLGLLVGVSTFHMGSYIYGISLTARREGQKVHRKHKNDGIAFLFLPAILYLVLGIGNALSTSQTPLTTFDAIAVLAFLALPYFLIRTLLVLKKDHDIGAFVSKTLALIPMVDFLFVSAAIAGEFSHPCGMGGTTSLQFLVLACPLLTLAALGLQKIAPAT